MFFNSNIYNKVNKLCGRLSRIETKTDEKCLTLNQSFNKGDLYKTFVNCKQTFFKTAGGDSVDLGLSVSAIVNGTNDCVYATGSINKNGTVKDFAGNDITSQLQDASDIFVAKLDSSGNQVFFRTAGGTSSDRGLSVSTIVNGDNDCVYVTGEIVNSGTVKDFAGNDITGQLQNSADIFVAKLDSSGDQIFFKTAGGDGSDSGNSVSAIVNGVDDCVYVTGSINEDGIVKDFAGNDITSQLQGALDIFVAKLDSSGNQIFFKTAGGTGSDIGLSVSAIVNGVDDCVYVTGLIIKDGTVEDFAGNNITSQLQDNEDIFVAKLDSSGNQIFFKTAGSDGSDVGLSVSAISDGDDDRVYVTGHIFKNGTVKDFAGNNIASQLQDNEDIFVAKLDSSGDQIFFKTAGSTANDSGSSVSAIVNGPDDCVYVTGEIVNSGTVKDFAGNIITSQLQNNANIFVAKLDSSGSQVFFKTAGGDGPDLGSSVSAIVNGVDDCVYVTGQINNSGIVKDFAGNDITSQLQSSFDIFVAKLDSSGNQIFFKTAGGTGSDIGRYASAIVNGTDDCVYVTGHIIKSGIVKDFAGNDITNQLQDSTDIFVAKISCKYIPQGIVTRKTINGKTKILFNSSCINGSILGLMSNTCYYWNGGENKITSEQTSLFLGCTDNNNIFVLNMNKI